MFQMHQNPGLSLELSDREKFCGIQGEGLIQILYFPMYVLYILTSPSAQNKEKSVRQRRLFLPNQLCEPLYFWGLSTILYEVHVSELGYDMNFKKIISNGCEVRIEHSVPSLTDTVQHHEAC